MDRRNQQTVLHTNNTRSSVPVYRNSIFSRFTKSYDHPKGDRGYKRNRHYKYIPAVIALLFAIGLAVALTPPTVSARVAGAVASEVMHSAIG